MFQKWWVYRTVLKYSSFIISVPEQIKIRAYGGKPASQPCVFIIGAPRTGSTILYQLITNLLDVLYINNLTNLSRYNPYFGFWLSRLFFKDKPHYSYTSRFGNTSHEGLNAPSEALFFYKWFPNDRHYTEISDLSIRQIDEFKQTLNSIINKYDRPLIIKNMSFGLRLKVLKHIMPAAKYIVIRRDPYYTAQSLLRARRDAKVPDGKVWMSLPKEYKKLEGLDPYELVVKQIYLIEQQIHLDLKSVSSDHVLNLDYERLASDFDAVLNEITGFLGSGNIRRPEMEIPEIHIQNKISIPEHEREELNKYILQLDWENYNTNIYDGKP